MGNNQQYVGVLSVEGKQFGKQGRLLERGQGELCVEQGKLCVQMQELQDVFECEVFCEDFGHFFVFAVVVDCEFQELA